MRKGKKRIVRRNGKDALKHYINASKAAYSSNWRLCADNYAKSLRASPDDFVHHRIGTLKQMSLNGFTSIFRNADLPASSMTDEDHKLLHEFGKASKHALHIALSAKVSEGIFRWDVGNREAAARIYRRVIQLGASATSKDREIKVYCMDPRTQKVSPKMSGELIDTAVSVADSNLAILEQRAPNKNLKAIKTDPCAIPSSKVQKILLQSVGENKSGIDNIFRVSGSACNSCGTAAGPKQKLSVCSRCKRAWYCSAKCQKNDWKTHKPSCVKLHTFRSGDTALLKGLTKSPTLNGILVQVIGPVEIEGEEKEQDVAERRWLCQFGSAEGAKKSKVKARNLERSATGV